MNALSTPEAMLSWLGESKDADEVADKLRELEIQGERDGACECPLSRAFALTGVGRTFVWPIGEWGSRDKGSVRWKVKWSTESGDVEHLLPKVLAAFAGGFDNGCYPDLILEQAS